MTGKGRYILMAILPVVVFLVAQYGALSIGMQLITAVTVLWHGSMTLTELLDEILVMAQSPDIMMLLTIVSGVICLPIFLIWYRKATGPFGAMSQGKKQIILGEKSRKWMVVPGILLIAVGCQYAGTFLVEILARLMPSWAIQYEELMRDVGIDVTGVATESVLVMVYIVIVAPVIEEVAFRGLSITYSLRALPVWGANILSAGLFAFMHANPLQGIYTFIFGLILGYLFARTGRIWITIAIHAVFNAYSTFLSFLLLTGDNPFINFIILLASLVGVYIGIKAVFRAFPSGR